VAFLYFSVYNTVKGDRFLWHIMSLCNYGNSFGI